MPTHIHFCGNAPLQAFVPTTFSNSFRIVVRLLLVACLLCCSQTESVLAQQKASQKKLKLAGVFASDMVLQQQTDAAIWGVAKAGAAVSVKPSWTDQVATATADEQGRWSTTIGTPAAGGPFEITVQTQDETIELTNVLSGEVWICSGQSNMQWKMRGFGVDFFKEDVEKAKHPTIRFCTVPQVLSLQAQDDVKTRWTECTPVTALEFSATAYFFGEMLRRELDVPIGLISTSWGGSPVESWLSEQALADFDTFQESYASYPELIEKHGVKHRRGRDMPKPIHHSLPSVLYNNMIHPLAPFAIRGVIWYQGESNVDEPYLYGKMFPKMIESWRQEWNQGDFPFYYVQIAPYHYRNKKQPAALLREAQLQTLQVANTGMVVTMDIGNPANIHPKQKKPVGQRLAMLALAKDYGRDDLVYSGPQYTSHQVEDGHVRLNFQHVGQGLASRDEQPLTHFTIAGQDRVFYPATAQIDGDSIVVRSDAVAAPVAVRYAWGNSDEPNLMNKDGLPASSFRTDSWRDEEKVKPQLPKQSNFSGERLPNIVYIMSDELAYFELSHMGNKKLHTPNIDRMAEQGIRFTRALSAAPVCGPTRCCMMTGLHMGHASMRTNGGGTPIRANEFTLADMLQQRGYATGGFGKWGIGARGTTGVPENHGFDVFFGYYDQVHAHSFYTPHLVRNSVEVPLANNTGGRQGESYSHYEIMNEGLQFIRDHKDEPFFCYLPITPPHGMYDIPATDPAFELYQNDPWMSDPNVPQDAKNYAAMVSMIDNDLKRVLDLLTELSLDENTIVFFTGDNGGQDRFASDEYPRGFFEPNVSPTTGIQFRGQKRSLYEGALRIPYLVRWPQKIAAAQVSDHLMYQVDVMATLAELTETKLPTKTDGISFLPTLLGEDVTGHAQQQHRYMYWEYLNQVAVRKGDWKAIKPGKDAAWELYDLNTDVSESTDVSGQHPELLSELMSVAKKSHVPARPGKFLRQDLQKRDRTAKWKRPEPLESAGSSN